MVGTAPPIHSPHCQDNCISCDRLRGQASTCARLRCRAPSPSRRPSCIADLLRHVLPHDLSSRRLTSTASEQQAAQPSPSTITPDIPDAAFASLTAALQHFESASAEARAAADGALDRQLELARARLSSEGASQHTDAASTAEPIPAPEQGAAAGSQDVHQELLDQRQSMDAVLGVYSGSCCLQWPGFWLAKLLLVCTVRRLGHRSMSLTLRWHIALACQRRQARCSFNVDCMLHALDVCLQASWRGLSRSGRRAWTS